MGLILGSAEEKGAMDMKSHQFKCPWTNAFTKKHHGRVHAHWHWHSWHASTLAGHHLASERVYNAIQKTCGQSLPCITWTLQGVFPHSPYETRFGLASPDFTTTKKKSESRQAATFAHHSHPQGSRTLEAAPFGSLQIYHDLIYEKLAHMVFWGPKPF